MSSVKYTTNKYDDDERKKGYREREDNTFGLLVKGLLYSVYNLIGHNNLMMMM